ncbi:hypothetical protein GL50803_005610 [Giardia duodenalis]|uniref:Uncharacterized protein n=1 Tax=Giardia intestinalis (strain ATCC 50803 / WB clone C6) TaxID=184922 RepID=A8BVS3_GIAIC|nr:hypothetical protein GL50803_005610 [Giardia intestinalis]KAE8301918.1 hypothetical protein GL50803_005610 [Giardia intestinalis]|eukprot:XP_001704533.1 Hypothetical protein GL50803_5610 [Giardia lamblia ATCC 50803]
MAKILQVKVSYIQTVDYGDYIEGERLDMGSVRGYSRVKLRVPIPINEDPRCLDVTVDKDAVHIKLGSWMALYHPRFPLDVDNAQERTARIVRKGPDVSFRIQCSFYLELVIPLLRNEAQALADARSKLEEVTQIRGEERPVQDADSQTSSSRPSSHNSEQSGSEEDDSPIPKVEPLTELRPGAPNPVVELAPGGDMTLQSLKKLAAGWQKNTTRGKVEDKIAQRAKLEQIHRAFPLLTDSPKDAPTFELQGFVFSFANPALTAAYSSNLK